MDSPKKLCLLSAIIYVIYSSTSDASCSLPQDLKNAEWEYNYTSLSDNLKKSTNIKIETTTIQHFVDYLKVFGTKLNYWTCIDSLDISVTTTVVVFKSDSSFTDRHFGDNMWLYLCMKLTKITTDLYYFYLLSEINASTEPNERAFMSADNDPMSSTVCQYTDSPNIRTLRRQGTSDVLPDDVVLCEPWDSACDVDASCSLPQDLRNKVWEYSYTQVSDSSKKVINLDIKTTTLQNSAINLNFHGSTLDDWTCINSLHISKTTTVVVFKSDATFSKGLYDGIYRLYLCMKLTRITADLYYFYLLSDVHTGIIPKERAFESKDSDPMSSIVCQYTDSPPKIRTLRKQGTSDVLPDDVVLCEPWDSACDVATTQKQSIPPMSTAIGTATSVKWIGKTQNAMKPSTSIEIDSTTDVITTGTTQKTSVPSVSRENGVKNTVSEILNHYTELIIAGGLIISGLLVVIAIYCLIKKRQKDPPKYTSTNVTNKEEEKVSHIYSEPSEVYHEYSEPSEVYHEYSEPSEVYHEYSEPARVFHVYRGRQHGYEETIFQE